MILTKINMRDTGRNLKNLRKSRGLSATDLMDKCGLFTPQSIYKWERGDSIPNLDNLLILSALYGISVNEILKYEMIEMEDIKTWVG